MQCAITEWKDWYSGGFEDSKAMLEIEGITNSADRAKYVVVLPMANIDSMTLMRM